MILSDVEIKEALKNGEIKIEGVDDLYIGPGSVDLHMDDKAKILFSSRPIYLKEDCSSHFRDIDIYEDITIHPGEFYVLSTKERLTFSGGIAGFIQGRSSLARLGINIHAAGFFDPNFSGTATLEVTNFTKAPIRIPKNTRICQMVFIRTGKQAECGYDKKKDSKYQNQSGPTLTKINKDYEI